MVSVCLFASKTDYILVRLYKVHSINLVVHSIGETTKLTSSLEDELKTLAGVVGAGGGEGAQKEGAGEESALRVALAESLAWDLFTCDIAGISGQ